MLDLTGVVAIATGDGHTVALKQDGTVWTWGLNASGQLGDGTQFNHRTTPAPVPGLSGVAVIVAGYDHTLALKQDGTVWAWGNNSYGQVGDGTTVDRTTPVQVPGLSGVVALAAGYRHSLARRPDGTVWAWGGNFSGQLGDGTTIDRGTPAPVPGLTGLVAVVARARHSLALKQDGTIWAWGRNHLGQLGDGTSTNRSTPVQVAGLTGVASIAAGELHTVALKPDGTVWAWGGNVLGQLGDGTAAHQFTPVLVVNENVNGLLDLIPAIPNDIPPDKIPPFFLATYKTGELTTTSLSADIRGITPIAPFAVAPALGPLAAGAYNVYVAAVIPNGEAALYYQLDSNNVWSVLTWPMAEFVRGVELGSQDALIRVNILQSVDLSQYIGASILVGYGTSPDEMVRNARYRTIFTVPVSQP